MKRTRRYTSYKRTCPTKKLAGSSVLVPVLACIAIIFTFVILYAWNFEAGEMASMLNILALGLGWGVSFGSLMLYTPQVKKKNVCMPIEGDFSDTISNHLRNETDLAISPNAFGFERDAACPSPRPFVCYISTVRNH